MPKLLIGDEEMEKYMKTKKLKLGKKELTIPTEALSYGIGLFGIVLLTGWMPDYSKTYFADFAFKNSGFDNSKIAALISAVFLAAGIIGAVAGALLYAFQTG